MTPRDGEADAGRNLISRRWSQMLQLDQSGHVVLAAASRLVVLSTLAGIIHAVAQSLQ